MTQSTAFAGSGADWLAANQRHLSGALDRIRIALQEHGNGTSPDSRSLRPAIPAYAPGLEVGGAPMALDRLVSMFGLSPFERDLILLTAGVELDSAIAASCVAADRHSQRPCPTFSLALAALPGAHWSALSPGAPVRHWRMVEVGGGHTLTTSPLRIDERVLHYLAGIAAPDARLSGLVSPVRWEGRLAPTHTDAMNRIVATWRRSTDWPNPATIQLRGDGGSMKRAIAMAACQSIGMKMCVTWIDAIPNSTQEAESFARYWEREAALSGTALLVDCDDLDFADAARTAALARFVDRTRGVILISLREPRRLGTRATIGIHVDGLSSEEQRRAWWEALGPVADTLNGQVDLLVSQFNLTHEAIRGAAAEAFSSAGQPQASSQAHEFGHALWDACREHSRPRLEDLAQRIHAGTTWADLVLPDAQLRLLQDISAHVRRRTLVYETWGFGGSGSRGLGISALFAGGSGTGKTMAAEVIANDLRLDLYRIDLSSVVSKYIGETEKNLRRIFDAAEEGGAILLFDEADALFGKRSDVKDSHDRYANIEVSYLLQRIECYKGLAILTTNMRSALDTAFLRRLRFVVQFPFPDAAHREAIWRRVFPKDTPLDGIRPSLLAGLIVPGGNIRNIALSAAFLAADAGEPVRTSHVLRAARSEYAKLEKPLTDAEVEGWV